MDRVIEYLHQTVNAKPSTVTTIAALWHCWQAERQAGTQCIAAGPTAQAGYRLGQVLNLNHGLLHALLEFALLRHHECMLLSYDAK